MNIPIPTVNVTIASQIVALRKARGMSQADLAREVRNRFGLRFQQAVLARIETGERDIRANEAFAVAEIFGVSIEQLAGDWASTDFIRSNLVASYRAILKTREELIADLMTHASDISQQERRLSDIRYHWQQNIDDRKDRSLASGDDDFEKAEAQEREDESRFDAIEAMLKALSGANDLMKHLYPADRPGSPNDGPDFWPAVLVEDARVYDEPLATYIDDKRQDDYDARIAQNYSPETEDD